MTGYTVELEHIGEGWSGDYDPSDPDDTPLLRFTVLDEAGEALEDASYCTRLPDTLSDPERELVRSWILRRVRETDSVKRTCEELSWLAPEDIAGMTELVR